MRPDRHAGVFRLLLRLYPRDFAREHGEEMAELFLLRLERARERRGWWGVVAHWRVTTTDVVRTALAERFAGHPSAGPTPNGPTHRSAGGDAGMETLTQDIRYAARRLAHTPVFTVSAVAILAIGIGANAAVFGLVDTLLFRPPPYDRPEEIVSIYQDSDDGDPNSTSFPAYRDMAARTDVFAGVAAVSPDGATWEAADGPRQAAVEYATASLFPVLGLTPSRGRWFSPQHDVVGGEMVAVVSYRTWAADLGADPRVVGSTVRLNGQPVTVIGVGPESYNGSLGTLVDDFWLSISSTPVGGSFRVANLERREDHWYDVKARLAPGVSIEQARAAMTGLANRLAESFPELNRGRDITVFAHDEVRVHPSVDGGMLAAGAGLMAIVGMVLVLACSNLANLLLVRGVSRSSETAVRRALGAGGARVGRLFLVESLLLSLAGGAAGVAVASWLIRLAPMLPLPTPGNAALDVTLDGRVLLFGLTVAVVTGVLFGLAPALRAARADVAGALREERRSGSGGRSVTLVRNGLVTVQVAVSLVLVVGAGLFVRSLAKASRVDAGFDVDRVAIVGTNLFQGGVSSDERAVVQQEIMSRIRTIPGVTEVALTSRLPAQGGGSTTTFVEGYTPPSGTGSIELAYVVADEGYLRTLGIPLVQGRWFTPDDRPESPVVVVVNATAANRFWEGDAIGKRIRPQAQPDAWREVVGVARDVAVDNLLSGPTPMFYYSAEQLGLSSFMVLARTEGDPSALLESLRTELRAVRPSLPVTRLGTVESHMGETLSAPRLAAAMLGTFSLLAVLLASLGIYAVVSFTVMRRSGEMGIRVALGAARTRLIAMVVAESLASVGVGLALGLVLAFLAAPALQGVLFEVGALDPVAFGGGAAVLLTVAALASWLPARRAAGANPVDALRAQ